MAGYLFVVVAQGDDATRTHLEHYATSVSGTSKAPLPRRLRWGFPC